MRTKLKPCPNCGSTNLEPITFWNEKNRSDALDGIECIDCEFYTRDSKNPEEAKKFWNKLKRERRR